jgi:hypothetical protein
MATGNGIPLDPAVVDYLRSRVDQAPAERVLEFTREVAKSDTILTEGGFNKITERNLPTFRARIKQAIRPPFDPPDGFRKFLVEGDLQESVLCVLSPEAIRHALYPLADLYGAARVAANLLLDTRPDVREIATAVRPRPEPVDRAAAARELADRFQPFRNVLAEIADALGCDSPPSPTPAQAEPATNADSAALQKRIARLEASEEEARKQATRSREKHREHLAAKDGEIARLTDELAKARAELKQIKFHNHALQTQVENMHAARDRQVQEQTEAELSSIRSLWLRTPLQLDRMARELTTAEDWGRRIQRILAAQAKHDRHYQNALTVQSRVDALRAAIPRLQHACANALDPLPETRKLLADAQAELARLEDQLPTARRNPISLAAFDAAVNAADDQEQLDRARDFIDQAAQLGILDPGQYRDLCAKCLARTSFLIVRDAPPPAAQPGRPAPTHAADCLLAAIANNDPVFLLVDGYNLILSSPRFRPFLDGDGKPGANARQALVDAFRNMVGPSHQCRVRIYFDSNQAYDESAGPSVAIVYSGGTGRHRADRRMLEDLEFIRSDQSAVPCFVATRDKEILKGFHDAAARHVPFDSLDALLRP